MSLNPYAKGRNRALLAAISHLFDPFLSQMWAPDDGVPPPSSDPTPLAPEPTPQASPPAPAPLVPTGGGVTPPAVPAPAPQPVAPVSPGQNPSQVFTEAEVNNKLAQQRAQYDRQVERLKLQNVALATGVAGADVLLEQIDRKAITYDDAGKATNLKDLLLAQRDALAATLGFAPVAPAAPPAVPPVVPPQIPPTNGGGAGNDVPLAEANLFTEGLFKKT